MIKIGCHVSIAGGFENAPGRAADLGCEVFQMFSRSPRGGEAPKITADVQKAFKGAMKEYGQEASYIHTPYYINFSSDKIYLRKSAARIVREELERGSLLGVNAIMTHLGSAGDKDRKEAMDLVAQGVKEVAKDYKGTTRFLLEISAGTGNIMGDTLEELKYIIEKNGANVGICLDTAHMFATGYDISSKFKDVEKAIADTVGLEKIELIHANDSKTPLGARRDRHEHIGEGHIGKIGFANMMKTFKNLNFILETEHDKVMADIKLLKKLRQDVL